MKKITTVDRNIILFVLSYYLLTVINKIKIYFLFFAFGRYLGLKNLITVNCLEPNNFQYTDDDIPYFLNPVILMWMYYILALEARLLIKPPVSITNIH